MIAAALLVSVGALIAVRPATYDPNRNVYIAIPGQRMEGLHDDDWATLLPDLLPAMRACMADDAKSFVLTARPMNHGQVLTRLEQGDGSRQDCIAEDLGGGHAHVERREPVAASSHMPFEGMPAFFRDRNPGCPDAKRVDAAQGGVLSWLAYPECR